MALSAVAAHAQIHFQLLKQEVIEERLRAYKGTDFDREAELKKLFGESGCKPEHLSEQAVKNKQPAPATDERAAPEPEEESPHEPDDRG